jgi:hypothetical protein
MCSPVPLSNLTTIGLFNKGKEQQAENALRRVRRGSVDENAMRKELDDMIEANYLEMAMKKLAVFMDLWRGTNLVYLGSLFRLTVSVVPCSPSLVVSSKQQQVTPAWSITRRYVFSCFCLTAVLLFDCRFETLCRQHYYHVCGTDRMYNLLLPRPSSRTSNHPHDRRLRPEYVHVRGCLGVYRLADIDCRRSMSCGIRLHLQPVPCRHYYPVRLCRRDRNPESASSCLLVGSAIRRFLLCDMDRCIYPSILYQSRQTRLGAKYSLYSTSLTNSQIRLVTVPRKLDHRNLHLLHSRDQGSNS